MEDSDFFTPKSKSVVLCQGKRFRQNITRWLTERRKRTREKQTNKQTKQTKKHKTTTAKTTA